MSVVNPKKFEISKTCLVFQDAFMKVEAKAKVCIYEDNRSFPISGLFLSLRDQMSQKFFDMLIKSIFENIKGRH